MRIFFLTRKKRVSNVVSDFYVFIFSVCSFFRAYNVVNTPARVPLKVQADIKPLMSAFFIKSAFLFRNQNQIRDLNFLPHIFSSLALKKFVMTASLLSRRKNITNFVIPTLSS